MANMTVCARFRRLSSRERRDDDTDDLCIQGLDAETFILKSQLPVNIEIHTLFQKVKIGTKPWKLTCRCQDVQVMTTGQKVMLDYQGTNYIFTVNEAAIQEHNYNVVNETLRIANIIGGVFRQAMTDVDIKGYTIPKGWKVFASLRAVHLNPEYFTDARVFNPWRWQQSNSGEINTANVFTPFGGGPRRCPGYELARVELAVFLHHLVTRLSLTYKLHSSPNSPELLE